MTTRPIGILASMKFGFAVLSVVIVAGFAALVPSASAHEISPNFVTTLGSVTPQVKGLDFEIVDLGDQVQIVNTTGRRLDVPGYSGEPYLRFLPDGTVQRNGNSPATYLNADRLGTTDVPAFANEKARPIWKNVADGGRYLFHDHRVHYMGKGTPPQVKDEGKRTKVFDWKVPMSLAGRPVVASGTLTWVPTRDDGGGIGAGQIALAVLAALLLALLALFVIRRRGGRPPRATAPKVPKAREENVKEAW